MSNLQLHQYPYDSDNYGVLLHDSESGATACIDTGNAPATQRALDETDWTLSEIWITHHHGDHTAGLTAVKSATGAKVYGPAYSDIGQIDVRLSDGEEFKFADSTVRIIHTPGHTTDMINFYIPSEKLVFTGDTLFTLGCGRIFEGDADMMWNSLQKLMALPKDTLVYSSHEYTLANAAFALSVDSDNAELQARAEHFKAMRERGEPTVPSTLAEELSTNPFLRASDPAIRATLGLQNSTDAEVFAEIRRRKDAF